MIDMLSKSIYLCVYALVFGGLLNSFYFYLAPVGVMEILAVLVSLMISNILFIPTVIIPSRWKTRWGSCSNKGNLNFNWKLILLAPELLDYVVVHELAHRREMNHSKNFWKIVEAELPDYRERRRRLKECRI